MPLQQPDRTPRVGLRETLFRVGRPVQPQAGNDPRRAVFTRQPVDRLRFDAKAALQRHRIAADRHHPPARRRRADPRSEARRRAQDVERDGDAGRVGAVEGQDGEVVNV